MRKAAAVILAAALLLTSSCGTPKYHYEVRRNLSFYFTNADTVIETVRKAFRERSRKITVGYTSSSDNMDDIPAVMNEIVKFAMSETDDPCEGDYIYHQYGGYDLGYTRTDSENGCAYLITLTPEYYTDPEQEEKVTRRTDEIIESLKLGAKTDEQKVRAVYDYIYDNVEYDRIHRKNEHYHLKSTAYAALFNGCAVCQGYAVLTYRLMREAGLDARVITGTAIKSGGTEYHAWNIVRVDGEYYNIDITWDKLSGDHGYYLRSDKSFSADHIRDPEYSGEPFYEEYPMSHRDIDY